MKASAPIFILILNRYLEWLQDQINNAPEAGSKFGYSYVGRRTRLKIKRACRYDCRREVPEEKGIKYQGKIQAGPLTNLLP